MRKLTCFFFEAVIEMLDFLTFGLFAKSFSWLHHANFIFWRAKEMDERMKEMSQETVRDIQMNVDDVHLSFGTDDLVVIDDVLKDISCTFDTKGIITHLELYTHNGYRPMCITSNLISLGPV